MRVLRRNRARWARGLHRHRLSQGGHSADDVLAAVHHGLSHTVGLSTSPPSVFSSNPCRFAAAREVGASNEYGAGNAALREAANRRLEIRRFRCPDISWRSTPLTYNAAVARPAPRVSV